MERWKERRKETSERRGREQKWQKAGGWGGWVAEWISNQRLLFFLASISDGRDKEGGKEGVVAKSKPFSPSLFG